MAEVMDAPADALDRPEGQPSPAEGSPLPPPPPPPRRRERDSRERRDDYYDSRNRSPPPPLVSRDREYRRRSSLSPPPYRDRRHSPPRRSPPQGGFKRSRRDDGGYERRRGSPRYGYDYGGYDRGGRGGYDERAHGRYMTRPSDWPDTGRGGFDGSHSQREGLMTYKQFIQELEDDILPAEAERSSHYLDPDPILGVIFDAYADAFFDAEVDTFFAGDEDAKSFFAIDARRHRSPNIVAYAIAIQFLCREARIPH